MSRSRRPPVPKQLPSLPSLDDVLRVHALHVLELCDGNRQTAAKLLGIDRKTLYRMLHRWRADDTSE